MTADTPNISLEPLRDDDRNQFILDNQEAFNYGALEEFGRRDDHFEEDGQIIARSVIERAIDAGEAYRIVLDGKKVGGLVLRVQGDHGDLDLLFVSPYEHSKGIGYAAWQAVEKMHPEVHVWELVTPYFEKRNIHFYVNRCGFHIVEFFNSHHPDPHEAEAGDGAGAGATDTHDGAPDEMFRFEKRCFNQCDDVQPETGEATMTTEDLTPAQPGETQVCTESEAVTATSQEADGESSGEPTDEQKKNFGISGIVSLFESFDGDVHLNCCF